MVPVHIVLRGRRARIVHAWEELARRDGRTVGPAGLALREGIAPFLSDLAAWLESGEPPSAARLSPDSRARIVRGLADGVELADVLDGVRLLREATLRVLLDEDGAAQVDGLGPAARADDLVRLNAGFDVAISDGVVQLVAERDRRAAAERARGDAELRVRDERYRTLFQSMDEGFCIVEVLFEGGRACDQLVLEANPAFERHSGLRGAVGRRMREIDPDLDPAWLELLGAVALGGEPLRVQRAAPSQGRTYDVHAFRIGRAEEHRVAVLFTDVTARQRADEAIRASEQRLRAVLEQLPFAVAVLGMDGQVVAGNSALRRFEIRRPPSQDPDQRVRWSATGADGCPLPPEQWPGARALRGDTVSPGIAFRYRPPDGAEVHTIVTAVPLRDPAGLQTGVISVIQDVTPLARAEAELRRANQQKTEFLAMLSHELRNPLTPIRNGLWLLEHSAAGTDAAARARDVLLRQTEHLTRLVDDLLDVTRITHGKTEVRRARLDLRDVVRAVTDDVRSVFEHAAVELRVEQAAGPIWVDGDATRLAQVLGNLLGNAVKFTPARGRVTVRLAADAGRATLSVRDTGLGMAPGEEERMFEPFAQGGQGLARTRGGLGLGLALVKGLVELHGGTVRAASEGPDRGSEFVVSLPLAEEPAPGPRAPRARAGPGRSVLIVEDNVDAGETLAEILELSGHRVRVARDARSGLALGRELRPDVVLCDIGLPDMSGYEFARAARRDPALAPACLVAITGYAQPEDRDQARQAGFDAHLPKPPPIDAIEALLAEPPRSGPS